MCDQCNKLLQIREACDHFIHAAEDWAPSYKKDKKSFDKIVLAEAKALRGVKKYFKTLSPYVTDKIDWSRYETKVAAEAKWTVDVDFEDDGLDDTFVELLIEPLTDIAMASVGATQKTYGLPKVSKTFEQSLKENLSDRLYQTYKGIGETTKERINNSIADSIKRGLTTDEAKSSINEVIQNDARSEMIAQSESVRAYQEAMNEFVNDGNVPDSQTWEYNGDGSCDVCAPLADMTVAWGETFDGYTQPGDTHPRCRCNRILNYPSGDSEVD